MGGSMQRWRRKQQAARQREPGRQHTWSKAGKAWGTRQACAAVDVGAMAARCAAPRPPHAPAQQRDHLLDALLVLAVRLLLGAVGAARHLPLDVGPDAAQLLRGMTGRGAHRRWAGTQGVQAGAPPLA